MGTIPNTDLAWAAGFLDGEGYLCLQPVSKRRSDGFRNRKPRLEVAQVRVEPLLKLKQMFGGQVIQTTKLEGRRQAYRWDVVGAANVRNALDCMLPYMVVKRREAEILLAFIEQMNVGQRGGWRRMSLESQRLREDLYETLTKARSA